MESGSIENCNFTLISQNVRGLGESLKRKTIFEEFKKQSDITFLQETHGTPETEKVWESECGGQAYFSHGASNARGVMIILSEKLDVQTTRKITDKEGRFIILTCTIQGTKFLIYNVYAPNDKKDHEAFLKSLEEKLDEISPNEYEYIISAGDWNFTYEEIDRSGGNYTIWTENEHTLNRIKEKYDLIDIWRTRNPEKKRYTWRKKRPLIQSRIDRLYISDTLQYNVSRTEILPGKKSDHSAIMISIKPTKFIGNTGPNYWKFNNSLLKNNEFTDGLKKYITTDIENECKDFANKQVKWEFTKYRIKQWSIRKSKQIAKERRSKEYILERKIKILEEKMGADPNKKSFEDLEQCKCDLDKIQEQKMQALIIQSRIQHYEEGEKSSAFFLNQIKQNKRKSTIRKLIVDEQEITDQQKITEQLKTFYSRLYTKNINVSTGNWIKDMKCKGLIPQLSEESFQDLDAPLDMEELKKTLEKCSENKSPGNDGLTKEFYSFFWKQICETLHQSYMESIKLGKLSTSQRQNIITLLEKAGKDKTFIKNWRPISLINFDTKLLSKTYADRLKHAMPSLVHPNQVAYVKNRFIGEGIRTIEETMLFTKKNKLEAYALAVDFEKAFDSVDWEFMWEALESYNIPKSFIHIIKVLYNDMESCVMNNGTSTQYFKIERGVRQGDPIAAYIFTLVIELLAINIRDSEKIEGLNINNNTIKLSMYADDMTGLVIGLKSVTELMTLIKDFKQYSGLGVNEDKTELMPLGCSDAKILICSI